jgi:hypothetical protein
MLCGTGTGWRPGDVRAGVRGGQRFRLTVVSGRRSGVKLASQLMLSVFASPTVPDFEMLSASW